MFTKGKSIPYLDTGKEYDRSLPVGSKIIVQKGILLKVLLKSNLKRKFIVVKCDICDKILREKKKKNCHNVSTKEISESVES